jgi:hypothetical protein
MARPGDEGAAGDGLRAFGAALILPVQVHQEKARMLGLLWVCSVRNLALTLLLDEKQQPQLDHA